MMSTNTAHKQCYNVIMSAVLRILTEKLGLLEKQIKFRFSSILNSCDYSNRHFNGFIMFYNVITQT